MGGSLVADGRNKNGTGSVRETVFTEMINKTEKLERKRCVLLESIIPVYDLNRSRKYPHAIPFKGKPVKYPFFPGNCIVMEVGMKLA